MTQSILITRPKDQAQKIVQHLEKSGFEVFIEPTFLVEKIDPKNSLSLKKLSQEKIQAIILTSGNAAEVAFAATEIFNFDKNIKIFAVGQKTAEIFVSNGFANIKISQRNSAEDLKKLILSDQELSDKKSCELLLYFCGEFITLDFKIELEKQGFRVEKITSYKIIEEKSFSENFLKHTKKSSFDFVLLYSKNSARHFCDLCKKHNLLEYFQASKILCLSDKILSYLHNFGFKNSATFDEIPTLKKFYE
ncbi:MAG: uroporphyrinogen-III synthase [Proteobacteria bacterium]|nr:uroporphyrinogen-III synthase [Pseudomonadota bacterium]